MLETSNANYRLRGSFHKLRGKVNKERDRRHSEINSNERLIEEEWSLELIEPSSSLTSSISNVDLRTSKKQIIRLHPRPMNQELWGLGPTT